MVDKKKKNIESVKEDFKPSDKVILRNKDGIYYYIEEQIEELKEKQLSFIELENDAISVKKDVQEMLGVGLKKAFKFIVRYKANDYIKDIAKDIKLYLELLNGNTFVVKYREPLVASHETKRRHIMFSHNIAIHPEGRPKQIISLPSEWLSKI